jgi:hypothetical protein
MGGGAGDNFNSFMDGVARGLQGDQERQMNALRMKQMKDDQEYVANERNRKATIDAAKGLADMIVAHGVNPATGDIDENRLSTPEFQDAVAEFAKQNPAIQKIKASDEFGHVFLDQLTPYSPELRDMKMRAAQSGQQRADLTTIFGGDNGAAPGKAIKHPGLSAATITMPAPVGAAARASAPAAPQTSAPQAQNAPATQAPSASAPQGQDQTDAAQPTTAPSNGKVTPALLGQYQQVMDGITNTAKQLAAANQPQDGGRPADPSALSALNDRMNTLATTRDALLKSAGVTADQVEAVRASFNPAASQAQAQGPDQLAPQGPAPSQQTQNAMVSALADAPPHVQAGAQQIVKAAQQSPDTSSRMNMAQRQALARLVQSGALKLTPEMIDDIRTTGRLTPQMKQLVSDAEGGAWAVDNNGRVLNHIQNQDFVNDKMAIRASMHAQKSGDDMKFVRENIYPMVMEPGPKGGAPINNPAAQMQALQQFQATGDLLGVDLHNQAGAAMFAGAVQAYRNYMSQNTPGLFGRVLGQSSPDVRNLAPFVVLDHVGVPKEQMNNAVDSVAMLVQGLGKQGVPTSTAQQIVLSATMKNRAILNDPQATLANFSGVLSRKSQ